MIVNSPTKHVLVWCLLLHDCLGSAMYMQIIAPDRHFVPQYDLTDGPIYSGLSEANQRRSPIRQAGYSMTAALKTVPDATPSAISQLFCDQVFHNNASVIMVLNYYSWSSRSARYITDAAVSLGYPVISRDPFYHAVFESSHKNMVLQIGPTIIHDCEAMILLMGRYNWEQFSILTTIDISQDFIDCIDDQVNKTSVIQGFLTKPRFNKIAQVVLDLSKAKGFFTDEEITYVKSKLTTLIKAKARIILLHIESSQLYNVIEVTEEMGLTGASYGWILTSTSMHGHSANSYTKLPLGILGMSRPVDKNVENAAVGTALTIWTEAMKSLLRHEDHRSMDLAPVRMCAQFNDTAWTDGHTLYKYLKGVKLIKEGRSPVSFTDSGIIEHVELSILNIRPGYSKIRGKLRKVRKWETVGRIIPHVVNGRSEMAIETKEIVWPGLMTSPPKGKPDRRFFRIVTRQEAPFMIYVAPEDNGECGHHSVPCVVNSWSANRSSTENITLDYCCTGLCIEVLETLAAEMMFDFVIYDVPDGQWGVQDPVTGEWNGLVREIQEDRADMVLTSFLINKLRMSALDFSVPFLESGITIMVSIWKGAISPYAFLEPYDFFTWILILVFSVHVTGAAIFIFEWLSPSGLDRGNIFTMERKFSSFRSFWLVWGILFAAGTSADIPKSASSRFLANVWALFALVFLASYTANLAAFMITIDEYYDLSGIEDWRMMHPTKTSPSFKFGTIANSSSDVTLQLNYKRMNKYMSRYNQQDLNTATRNLKDHKIHAFIYDANVLEYVAGRDEDCSLLTVGRWYAMSGYGIAFKKGTTLKEEVDEHILKMQYNGDIERMQEFWLSGACHAKKETKNKSNSQLGHLNSASAFILLAAGVLLGVVLMAIEHLYFKFGRKCLKKYDKRGCCAIVSLNMGKSLAFEQTDGKAIAIRRPSKCQDPTCDMKHQLEMALLENKQLRAELSTVIDRQSKSFNAECHEQLNDVSASTPGDDASGTSVPVSIHVAEVHVSICVGNSSKDDVPSSSSDVPQFRQ